MTGSWIDVSSETGSPIPSPMAVSFVEGRNSESKQQSDSPAPKTGSKSTSDRLSDLEWNADSDPGSPAVESPNSVLIETSSCSMIDAVLLKEDLLERSRRISSDWLWDWTVRCETVPTVTDWKDNIMMQQQQKKLSLRQWAIRRGFLTKEVLSFFLMSNIVSLILGAGIGYSILLRKYWIRYFSVTQQQPDCNIPSLL